MTKRQLIDEILSLNHSAHASFLAKFADGELSEYLEHLQAAGRSPLQGEPGRYERYFRDEDAPHRRCSQRAPVALAAAADGSASPSTEGWLF